MLLLLIAVAISALVSPTPRASETCSTRDGWVQFGQTVVLADFDRDGLGDRARVGGTGQRKSIEVFLSNSGTFFWLHFVTRTEAHGSLFAHDLNNDGDTDLIWADMVRPDAAVVWLGDGVGRFEQVSATRYASQFTPGTASFAEPDESSHEIAVSAGTTRGLDQIVDASCQVLPGSIVLVSHQRQPGFSSSAQRHPSQRGPPSIRV
ncbi:MAG TPA: VCBS repeat-containing protein [Blastocatellia bacterium]|nr:VCBS repeat-containing protein [Blastocatellia bacterium]